MKFVNVAKRVLLFALVNILVLTTISLVLGLLGVGGLRPGTGGYWDLMLFCLIWGMGGAFISLGLSRVMAKWFMGVRVIDSETRDPQLQQLLQTVKYLAERAELPMPQVGIYDSPEVNAFATGPTRSRALVAVSTGLLNNMGRNEVEGVLGHEMAHVANGDMVTMTLLQGVINAFVMFLARVLAFMISQAMRSRDDDDRGGGFFMQFMLYQLFQFVLSLFGMIVVCWFSRWREFRADAGGARFAGRDRMINALRALQQAHEGSPPVMQAASNTDSFRTLKISGKSSGLMRLFSTHPPLEERIARLESLRVA